MELQTVQLELKLHPNDMVNLDGYVCPKGVRYLGNARKQNNGKYHCLANVGGALCLVELDITFNPLTEPVKV